MDWKLFKAAASGDVDFLRQMELAHKLDFNQVTPQKNTVLHIAVNSGQKEFAKQVLGLCSSLLLKANAKGDSPLHVAARIGCLELVELFISCARTQINEDVESQEVDVLKELLRMANLEKKETALHVAVRNGHFGIVKLLTEADVGLLELVNKADQSPLFLAAVGGFSDIVLHILKIYPASPCGGKNGMNALHGAVIQQRHGIIEVLVGIRPELTKEADKFKWTPLHYAAFYGYLEAVKLLLQCDSSAAYLSNKDEMSPLHIAAYKGRVNIARVLIQCCPFIWELVNKKGQTALHIAVIAGEEKMIKYILEVPELVGLLNEPDKEGNTPLHLAAVNEKYKIISILAHDKRVDKRAVNNKFFTPIDVFHSKKPKIDSFAVAKVYYQMNEFGGIPDTPQCVDTNSIIGMKGKDVEISPGLTKDDHDREDESLARTFEAHLVVAALIATVTFAAAFTMPGGYKSEDPDQGVPNFIDRPAFKLFVILDSTALAFSTASVYLLFYASYFGYRKRPDYFHRVLAYIYIAIVGMVLAAVAGIHAMLGKSSIGLAIFSELIFVTFILVFSVEWFFGEDLGGPDVLGLAWLRRHFKNRLLKSNFGRDLGRPDLGRPDVFVLAWLGRYFKIRLLKTTG